MPGPACWPRLFCVFLFCSLSFACSDKANIDPADIIFTGDNILTVDLELTNTTGVAVRGDKIVFVGEAASAMNFYGPNTRLVELGDRALIPGFVDSHGHIAATARFIDFANVSAPPVGTVENIDDLVDQLAEHLTAAPPAGDEWLVGYGYDDSLIAEQRHPNRDDLDKVSSTVPIFIAHVSGHLGVVNSAALALLDFNKDTPDPPGGVIQRRQDGEANGILEESAAGQVLWARLADAAPDEFERMLRETIAYYAKHGITSIQDGGALANDIAAFRSAAEKKPFGADIAAYQYMLPNDPDSLTIFEHDVEYSGGYRVAGIKFALDGSPQGRTAWMSQPYTELPHGAEADYVAYPTVEPDDYKAAVTQVIRRNIPVLVHANGDAAIELMIDGVETATSDGIARDHRSVAIHAQLMRADQLDRAATLGVIPSFFSSHTFFWGDWHLRSFGDERGNNISPTRWAIERDVDFTIHNDTPVVPPDMLRLIWATVNRETRSGATIGPAQRLTVDEALYAATLGGAYQLFEEESKGSITTGKQADLVILSADPREVPSDTIKDIVVLETFSRGRLVFQKQINAVRK